MKRRRQKITKRLISMALTLCLTVTICGCSGKAATDETLYTGEYFKDFTNKEQAEYVLDVFYSSFAHLQTPKELGLASLVYSFGILKEINGIKFDEIMHYGNGDNSMALREIPVSYSLFLKAQEYEQKRGIDSGDAAARHGKQHAIKAQSVQDVMTMIFRKNVPVAHASVDGAEYVESEQVYVFDELVNPYQSFIDKGWELQYMNVLGDEVYEKGNWGDSNAGILYFFHYIPLWYDKEGNIYDMYGGFIVKQDDPSNRLQMSDYTKMTENAKGNAHAYYSTIVAVPDISEGENKYQDLNMPIDMIVIGKQILNRS